MFTPSYLIHFDPDFSLIRMMYLPLDGIKKHPQTFWIRGSLSNHHASFQDADWDDSPMMVCGICNQELSLRDRFTVNQQEVDCPHVFHEGWFLGYCREHSYFIHTPNHFIVNPMGVSVRIPCAICRRSYMQIDPSMSYMQA
jgi:uncharacterized CHY-type Zn-finger protein